MKMGLFGGSFNPIHNGHLHLAESIQKALQLDGVVLMPAGQPPHKSDAAYASAAHRLAMCRLAAQAYDWMTVSDYEIKKNGKSYTVETLRALHEQQPDVEWTLMLGSDMLLCFDRWYCWQEILTLASLCVISRTNEDLALLNAKAVALQARMCALGKKTEICVLSVRGFPVSSTQIREKVQKNENCSCLLPQNVVQYMDEYGLYRLPNENKE